MKRIGNGAARMGNARERCLTEKPAGSAKSVFHFDVQGPVAKSTHAGIHWLPFIRQRLGQRVHFWSFDGWAIPGQPGENDRSGSDCYDPPSDGAPRSMNSRRLPARTFA